MYRRLLSDCRSLDHLNIGRPHVYIVNGIFHSQANRLMAWLCTSEDGCTRSVHPPSDRHSPFPLEECPVPVV